jgi:hypothetical protein
MQCSKRRARVALLFRIVVTAGHPPFAERDVMECGAERTSPLFRLDVGRSDHLGPLLDLVGNKFPEFGRRHWHRHIRKVG